MPDLNNVLERLHSQYGHIERPVGRPDPVDELVMTILSQNTSDTNTERAFESLKAAFPDWISVVQSDTSDVVDSIRSGGLATQKAPRIQHVLKSILDAQGSIDLGFLYTMPLDEATAWLTALPGVGPKTAACVLLFSLDRPTMPVDTHVHRVALRLHLIPERTTAEAAHSMLGKGLDADAMYQAHMLLIRHGRDTCKARYPRCQRCVLRDVCPSANLF